MIGSAPYLFLVLLADFFSFIIEKRRANRIETLGKHLAEIQQEINRYKGHTNRRSAYADLKDLEEELSFKKRQKAEIELKLKGSRVQRFTHARRLHDFLKKAGLQ